MVVVELGRCGWWQGGCGWWHCCLHYAVQERLTREIGEAILSAVNPTGVGVVVEAT